MTKQWKMSFLVLMWLSVNTIFVLGNLNDTIYKIPASYTYAVRSQRDLMANISIDQLPLVGIDLQGVLFNDDMVNETDALINFEILLDLGIQNIVVDIEMKSESWVISNTTTKFKTVLDSLGSFLNNSDNNLSANIITMFLRIHNQNNTSHSSKNETAEDGQYGNIDFSSSSLNITYLLENSTGSAYIYAPSDLANDQSRGRTSSGYGFGSPNGWPTLSRFLYEYRKRLVITELTDVLNNTIAPYVFDNSVLHYDAGNSTLDCPMSYDDIMKLSNTSWRFLNSNFGYGDISQYVLCGYSPIINNSYSSHNISAILPLLQTGVVWSWGLNQPESETSYNKSSLVANNCAAFTYTANNNSASWQVENCYEDKSGLCESTLHPFTYLITDYKDDYFSFDNFDGTNCPDDHKFSIPLLPLAQKALIIELQNSNTNSIRIWVDMNSISVTDCWVTGGPYATCPYQKVISRRSFSRLLTPACVCSFGILVIVTYLNLLELPIHDNRRSWKKILDKTAKTDFEGVPS